MGDNRDGEHRRGDWFQTYTGKCFWILDHAPEDVDIYDIAHALSLTCRFGGHCKTFYSVAEHSVNVSLLCPERFALWGLLHDATEAYLPDVLRPVKPLLEGFKDIENALMRTISMKFDLGFGGMPPEVKSVDDRILADEASQQVVRLVAYRVDERERLIDFGCVEPATRELPFQLNRYTHVVVHHIA